MIQPAFCLTTPLLPDALGALRAGDVVELSGTVLTARDAVHTRLARAAAEVGAQSGGAPVDFAGSVVFYAGPAPARPGQIIGPIAATTSARMDGYLELMYRLGVAATIGKGARADEAAALCKRYGRVYFLSVGGAAALTARQVRSCHILAWEDLGPESLKKLSVENLRLTVGIDTHGRVFQNEQIPRYRTAPAL